MSKRVCLASCSGYPIEQLAEKGDLADTIYLLLNGELPNQQQRASYLKQVRGQRLVHESLIKFYSGFRHDAHPMAIMVGVVGALSSFFNDGFDIRSPASRMHCCFNIIAKMPTLAAMAYKTAVRALPLSTKGTQLAHSSNSAADRPWASTAGRPQKYSPADTPHSLPRMPRP